MSHAELWKGPTSRLRKIALSLFVSEYEYAQLDEVLGNIILTLRREREMLSRYQPDTVDSRYGVAQQFTDSIAMLQEDSALLVADWKDGMAHEVFAKKLEEYKIRWYRQLPK